MAKPAVNQQLKLARGKHGDIVVTSAWCTRCQLHVMPGSTGRCNRCNGIVVDEDEIPAREALARLEHATIVHYTAGPAGEPKTELADAAPAAEDDGGKGAAAHAAGDAGASASSDNPEEAQTPPEPKRRRGGRRPTWTEERALELLRGLAVDGVAPARVDFIRSGISNSVIKRLFGDYTTMVGRAGLTMMLIAKHDRRTTPPAPEPEPAPEEVVEPANREPAPDALLYGLFHDPAALEDEAEFLRRRAAALDDLGIAVRRLQEIDG